MVFTGVIAPPQIRPSRFGLFSAADVIEHTDTDEHWIGGFDVESESCNFIASLLDVCQPDEAEVVFDVDDQPRSWPTNPFSIQALDKCSTFGFASTDRRARVLRQLDLVTQKAVERELWEGSFGTTLLNSNRSLASAAASVLGGGTAKKPSLALALLEGAIGSCGPGFEGTLHLPRAVASMLTASYRQVPEDPKSLETMLGTRVAAGDGYTGTGPADQAATATTYWAYATGPVTVHLGPKVLVNSPFRESVDMHINDLILQAERPAAVTWDGCCHFAVLVDITL